ncbi:hypothetical protein AVEN_217903-1 [Araneus ventricosus]|uniref:Uncharacterized protein n=1 Tax=Araneus ventricosus TaxID=182803 RepID=A0A4Y2EFS4_ARAVE|nr:hypothetical protein AVEN_217903-1 [Araneus ventricosus]
MLWTENGNGLLRSPPYGLDELYGECPAFGWIFTTVRLHSNSTAPHQNRSSVHETDENWSCELGKLDIQQVWIHKCSIWTTRPKILKCDWCRFVGKEGGSLVLEDIGTGG